MDILNPIIWVRPTGLFGRLFGHHFKVWLSYAVEYDRRDVRTCEEVIDFYESFKTKDEVLHHINMINSRISYGNVMIIGDECLK